MENAGAIAYEAAQEVQREGAGESGDLPDLGGEPFADGLLDPVGNVLAELRVGLPRPNGDAAGCTLHLHLGTRTRLNLALSNVARHSCDASQPSSRPYVFATV